MKDYRIEYNLMLFQKIKDKLFWKYQFYDTWQVHFGWSSQARNIFNPDELEKQKYFWGEKKGQQLRYSPRKAAYSAFKELADKWYSKKEYYDEAEILEVAYVLESLFPYIDENGNYQDVKQVLDEPWKGFARRFWRNWKATKNQEEDFANELQSYRFDMVEVHKAWEELKSGNIPFEALKIWKASYPRKWAKDIISETNVTMRSFCFWMCVFKEHLGYYEQLVSGKHMYISSNKDLSDAINSKINEPPL